MSSNAKLANLLRFLVVLSAILTSGKLWAEQTVLRVGVYENPPKLVMDPTGQVSGILGDLLQVIALQENWKLVAVPCYWNDCLKQLAKGEIDILPDVAASSERAEFYDFHSTAALLSWSQIYVTREHNLSSLLELDGKRLALLKGCLLYTSPSPRDRG